MATEKQVKCIYALSKSLNKSVEYTDIRKLPNEVASKTIDELREELEAYTKEADEDLNKEPFSDVGFGMACKLVDQYLIHNNQFLTPAGDYNKMVREVYERHKRAKKALKE